MARLGREVDDNEDERESRHREVDVEEQRDAPTNVLEVIRKRGVVTGRSVGVDGDQQRAEHE